MPAFIQHKRIRFQHCDPAGLIFYPKAFELVGEVIEDWFMQWSGLTAHEFHKQEGMSLPTVRTACEFFDQVHVSDMLEFSLLVIQVGASSIELRVQALRDAKPCFAVTSTLVQVTQDGDGRYKSSPITDDFRRRLTRFTDALGASSEGPS